jgi:ubiquinone biosynthesis protein
MIQPLRAIKTYRRFKRYRQVTFTLVKFGFGDVADRIGANPLWVRLRHGGISPETPTPQRLRLALSNLGPTFVKFGQLLSTRPDILPEKYLVELEKLQDHVAPFPLKEVNRIFLEELGKDPESVFAEFEKDPIASGSIAQVHRARLPEGQTVAVKVQRPGIVRLIETDIEILEELAGLMEKHIPESRLFRPSELVRQFARTIRRELDFVAEAQAIERFRRNFSDDPTRFVPAVHWDATTSRILVTDYVQGIKVTDLEGLKAHGLDRKQVARNGARAILREVFQFHLFHADPHPGNFFVLENNVIAAIDYGIVGRLDEETAELLGTLMGSVVTQDVDGIVRGFRELGLLHDDVDQRVLRFDIREFIDRYYGLALDQIDTERTVQDILSVVRRHRMILPVDLALLGRLLAVSAGVGQRLDPDFDVIKEARPFVKEFLARRMDPRRKAREMVKTLRDYQSVLKSFPEDFEEILAKVKKGQMLVSIHHEGLNRFILEMDRSSNRLSFSLIIAALVIGSSLIMRLDAGPTLFGLPVIGLAGYMIAGILGLWLVIAILRSGRI